MQPGLSRAIPMGILGFMLGALIVILLRGLQSLDPLWAPGPGIVVAVIMTAVFFIWGMGAFDPRLSIHGDPEVEEAVHEELATEAEKPRNILFSSVWQLATAVLVLAIVIGGFAVLPGGLALTQTVVPGASLTSVGYADVPLPFDGPTVQVSTLVIFAVFVIWAFISLVAVAAALGWLFSYLSRGLVEVKAAGAGGGTVALPAPEQEQEPRTRRDTIRSVVIFLVTLVILYFFFYYVAIGLIMPEPELPGLSLLLTPAQTLVFLSAVNALIFTLIILRTQLVLETVGRVARWLAKVLRSVPRFLQ